MVNGKPSKSALNLSISVTRAIFEHARRHLRYEFWSDYWLGTSIANEIYFIVRTTDGRIEIAVSQGKDIRPEFWARNQFVISMRTLLYLEFAEASGQSYVHGEVLRGFNLEHDSHFKYLLECRLFEQDWKISLTNCYNADNLKSALRDLVEIKRLSSD